MFQHSIDNILQELGCTRKDSVVRYMKKHYKENIDYISSSNPVSSMGRPKTDYMLTSAACELICNTYASKHRYIKQIQGNNVVHPLLMSVENATIGFITEIFKGIVEIKREYHVGKYKVDAYIPSKNIVIECDEHGHRSYNIDQEKVREIYIITNLKCTFLRFDPTQNDFDLSTLLNKLMKLIMV